MGSNFTPLKLSLIDEGRLLKQAHADLADCQEGLLAFRKKHKHRAKGAKATVTIQITLMCDDPDNEIFSVKALSKQTMPTRPPSVTKAMAAEDQTGRPCLWVRKSGSDDAPPAQGKLATDEGQVIDQETGRPAGK